MDRPQRIRIVIATVLGVISLFVATIGAEMAGAGYFWMSYAGGQAPQLETGELLGQVFQIAEVGRIVMIATVIAWGITVICVSYLLEVWAKWFIGPKETEVKPEEPK